MYKQAVKRSFARAASTYSRCSFVQREVGRMLISSVHELLTDGGVQWLLELGCGHGGTTALLLEGLTPSTVVLSDLSHEMLREARRHLLERYAVPGTSFSFINADMEQISRIFPKGMFDLVFSNSALHWALDFHGTVKGAASLLRPGGLLACTVFTRGTLVELSNILQETIGIPAMANGFLSSEEINTALLASFEPARHSTLSLIRVYGDVWSLLKGLKRAGVTPDTRGASRVHRLFRRDIARLDGLFQARYSGVVVRYEVVLFVGVRRS